MCLACASLFNMLMASHNQKQNMSIFCSINIVLMILCVCMRAANMLTYSEYKTEQRIATGPPALKDMGWDYSCMTSLISNNLLRSLQCEVVCIW